MGSYVPVVHDPEKHDLYSKGQLTNNFLGIFHEIQQISTIL
jgi:hypothetical protein